MENFNVVVENGVTLATPKRIAISPDKIVWVKGWGDQRDPQARILYCRNFDRQEPCDDLFLEGTGEAILSIIGECLFTDLFRTYLVYTGNNPDNYSGVEQVLINDWFINRAYATKVRYQDNIVNDAVAIEFTEGSFHRQVWYAVPGSIDGLVTTTTEEVATTTGETVSTTTQGPI
jgi:hypothetical protein